MEETNEDMEEIRVDWRDSRLIVELYMKQTTVVRINSEVTGVRQGCLISLVLFNIYAEAMIKEALHLLEERAKVEGVLNKAVRLADDQVMVVRTEKGLQSIMEGTN